MATKKNAATKEKTATKNKTAIKKKTVKRATAMPAKAVSNPKADFALRVAADLGDVAAVKRALANGAAVASADRTTGYTALHSAAGQGHLPIVRVLLAAGAPIDAEVKNARTTPLGMAIYDQQHEVIKVLLDAGARTDILYGRTQMSPLHNAAINEDPRSVELLLAAGADPDFRNKNRVTPLTQMISMAGSLGEKAVTAIARALLAAGADRAAALQKVPLGVGDEETVAYLTHLLRGGKGTTSKGKR